MLSISFHIAESNILSLPIFALIIEENILGCMAPCSLVCRYLQHVKTAASFFRAEEYTKYEVSRVLQNVRTNLPNYTASHSTRQDAYKMCDLLFAHTYNTEWHAAWAWGKFTFTRTSLRQT